VFLILENSVQVGPQS